MTDKSSTLHDSDLVAFIGYEIRVLTMAAQVCVIDSMKTYVWHQCSRAAESLS